MRKMDGMNYCVEIRWNLKIIIEGMMLVVI